MRVAVAFNVIHAFSVKTLGGGKGCLESQVEGCAVVGADVFDQGKSLNGGIVTTTEVVTDNLGYIWIKSNVYLFAKNRLEWTKEVRSFNKRLIVRNQKRLTDPVGAELETALDTGDLEGLCEGLVEGALEGLCDGLVEGAWEGLCDGLVEGALEGLFDGLVVEDALEGLCEGLFEGAMDGL